MKKEHNIEGLVLGGTGLSLILQNGDAPGINIFDTTEAHIESILDALK